MRKNLLIVLFLIVAGVYQVNAAPPADNATSAPTDSSQQIADVIVNSKIPVFVDFWAVWCAPCRLLNPIVKELEKEYKGKVLFLKVNVDVHRGLAQYFSVNAIPTIFIINDKSVVKAFPGLQTKEMYAAALDEVLAAAAAAKKAPAPVPAK